MTFKLPPLPFPAQALEPIISAETLSVHHGAHHKAYVEKLNDMLDGKSVANKALLEILKWSALAETRRPLFNNASQAWNHEFYWQSLRPPVDDPPGQRLSAEIRKNFGSVESLKKALVEAGVRHFGSGWVWLVADKNALKVITTHDAETPIIGGLSPLLTLDVWEHAYYIDYRNRREQHLNAVVAKLLNWDFAEANLLATMESAAARV